MGFNKENILPLNNDEKKPSKLRPLKKSVEEIPPLSDWTDEDLMLAFGEGNEEAFVELVKRYEKQIFNLCIGWSITGI